MRFSRWAVLYRGLQPWSLVSRVGIRTGRVVVVGQVDRSARASTRPLRPSRRRFGHGSGWLLAAQPCSQRRSCRHRGPEHEPERHHDTEVGEGVREREPDEERNENRSPAPLRLVGARSSEAEDDEEQERSQTDESGLCRQAQIVVVGGREAEALPDVFGGAPSGTRRSRPRSAGAPPSTAGRHRTTRHAWHQRGWCRLSDAPRESCPARARGAARTRTRRQPE